MQASKQVYLERGGVKVEGERDIIVLEKLKGFFSIVSCCLFIYIFFLLYLFIFNKQPRKGRPRSQIEGITKLFC